MAETDIAFTMATILGTMVAFLAGLIALQTPKENQQITKSETTTTTQPTEKKTNDNMFNKYLKSPLQKTAESAATTTIQKKKKEPPSSFLPSPLTHPSKRAYELFVAWYTPFWIVLFGLVVVSQIYEKFDKWTYLQFCGGLALPLVLQPVVFPSAGTDSPDAKRPFWERYSFKANVWIAVYSFIGNYWYTHYFYSVLKAKYTMPSHRLNNVPIAMFLATHFYFSTYHFFSNALLRKVVTTYEAGPLRSALFVYTIVVFSYFTAFMETLTISSYPYYDFEDRNMAYTVGSAFYGIYFLVSFPAFLAFDDDIDNKGGRKVTVWDTVVSSCGYGMMIMLLLDFVRLYLGIPLVVGVAGKSRR